MDTDKGKLTVKKVLVINHEVASPVGGKDFVDDIVINGHVLSGVQIRTEGNVQVNGCVEAASIVAGGDVMIKNGMQGNGKGMITAGGNVSGKFFEQVDIEAKGSVYANSIMNCNIDCDGMINVSGKFGIIVGGKIRATEGVKATMIGNMAEVPTTIEVGVSMDLTGKLSKLENKIQFETENLKKIDLIIERMDKVLEKILDSETIIDKKKKAIRTKIEKKVLISDMEKEKKEISELIRKTTYARIIISQTIYPKSLITINGVSKRLRMKNYNITYGMRMGEIYYESNI